MATDDNLPDVNKNPKAVRPLGTHVPKWGGKPEKHGSNVRRSEAVEKQKATERENDER